MGLSPPSLAELRRASARLLRLWGAADLEPRIEVALNPRMRTRAGVARLDELRVELNPRLLARHPERVEETVAHEVAHLVVWERFGRAAAAHGPEWAALMEAAGFAPNRQHRMDVRGLGQRRRRFYYLHQCTGCGAWWVARCVRRDRACRDCGPGEVRVSRAARTRAGLAALVGRAGRFRAKPARAAATATPPLQRPPSGE